MNSPLLLSAALAVVATSGGLQAGPDTGFRTGNPGFRSISQLAFGPDGVLFAADTKSATVVAIATDDTRPPADAQPIRIEGLQKQLSGLLGTAESDILVEDMAVNPASHRAYLAVSRGRGPDAVPALVRTGGGDKLELVSLDSVKFSKAEIPHPPADKVVGEGRRQSNPRLESITDLAFLRDQVLVAGLANEEFASTLHAIPFPFRPAADGTGVEIYHGAHGRFETRAPIRTFVPITVGNEPQIIAAYTCTPLVQLPVAGLKPGAQVRGRTVAELGNRNRPLDIISYEKDGKTWLLLANSSRGVMKVSTEGLPQAEAITQPVPDGGTKGLSFENVAGWNGVTQLDRLDKTTALVLRKPEGGLDRLESLALP